MALIIIAFVVAIIVVVASICVVMLVVVAVALDGIIEEVVGGGRGAWQQLLCKVRQLLCKMRVCNALAITVVSENMCKHVFLQVLGQIGWPVCRGSRNQVWLWGNMLSLRHVGWQVGQKPRDLLFKMANQLGM